MEATNYSDFRKGMKHYLDTVIENHSPLLVTRPKGKEVVVMSKEDYDSIEETIYLLRSPRNAERLLRGIERYNSGDTGKSRELIEDE